MTGFEWLSRLVDYEREHGPLSATKTAELLAEWDDELAASIMAPEGSEHDPSTGNGRLSGAEIVALSQVLAQVRDDGDGMPMPDWLKSAIALLEPLCSIRHDA